MSHHVPREEEHSGHIPEAPAGDGNPWMAELSALRDHQVDDLLAGRVPEGSEELAPVADFAGALRARVAAEPAPPMSPALAAQVASAPPSLLARRRPAGRRRAALAVAAASLAVGMGAAAAENALPGPLQDAVSSAADVVGVHVPRAAERDDGAPPDQTPGGAQPARPADPNGPGEPADPAHPATPAQGGADVTKGAGRGGSDQVPSSVEQPAGATGGQGGTGQAGSGSAGSGAPEGTGQPADPGAPADAGRPGERPAPPESPEPREQQEDAPATGEGQGGSAAPAPAADEASATAP